MEGLEEFRYFLFLVDPHSFDIWSPRREDAGENFECRETYLHSPRVSEDRWCQSHSWRLSIAVAGGVATIKEHPRPAAYKAEGEAHAGIFVPQGDQKEGIGLIEIYV